MLLVKEICPNCGRWLVDYMITSNPPAAGKRCFVCGWQYEAPGWSFQEVKFSPIGSDKPCDRCSNRDREKCDGCVLGTPIIT